MRTGVVYWTSLDDEISLLLSDILRELGHEVYAFLHDAKLPEDLDIILLCGPLGSVAPLGKQILAGPSSRRPALIFWITEQMWNPILPRSLACIIGDWQSRLERDAFQLKGDGRWKIDPRHHWLTGKAHRFRYYGDLHWLQQEGLLSILAVGSPWRASFLETLGFKPIIAYVGSHPKMGASLHCERDIPVLWFGRAGSQRRTRLLKRIRHDLARCGVEMLVVDGKENPFVFGEKRTYLLNRTKIVLNLLRKPWDENAMRYFVTAPNRALIVTEPTLPHTPFRNGVHLVESPVEQMAETICYYLTHEEERKKIADQAYDLVTSDLTMQKGVAQILSQLSVAWSQSPRPLPA